VEFNVEIGTGFIPANTGKGLPIGVIPVDSIFTPVRRVNHSVESVVAGQYEDMDRLILEVWTDGTITGVEAISEGADILTKQLAIFRDVARMSILEDKKNLLRKVIPSEQYDMPVEQLSLSTRTQNCLRRGGIATVGVLLERSEESLPSLPNFGQKSKEEVIRAMEEMGLIIPTGKTGGKSEPAVRQADGTESNVESDETSNSGS
jgi:DNA-directed RNA polymerase subunit alpha